MSDANNASNANNANNANNTPATSIGELDPRSALDLIRDAARLSDADLLAQPVLRMRTGGFPGEPRAVSSQPRDQSSVPAEFAEAGPPPAPTDRTLTIADFELPQIDDVTSSGQAGVGITDGTPPAVSTPSCGRGDMCKCNLPLFPFPVLTEINTANLARAASRLPDALPSAADVIALGNPPAPNEGVAPLPDSIVDRLALLREVEKLDLNNTGTANPLADGEGIAQLGELGEPVLDRFIFDPPLSGFAALVKALPPDDVFAPAATPRHRQSVMFVPVEKTGPLTDPLDRFDILTVDLPAAGAAPGGAAGEQSKKE